MSKYNCDVIQDLLALYHDGVCSEESCKAVEEHLAECGKCRAVAKQLEDTELESNIAEQAENIIGKHRKKQNKKLRIVLIVAAAIIFAMVLFWVLLPRIGIVAALNMFVPDDTWDNVHTEYYTAHDVTGDNLVIKDGIYGSIGVPADYYKEELDGDVKADLYRHPADERIHVLVIHSQSDFSDMSLFYRGNYEELSDEQYEAVTSVLRKWVGRLGNGMPDSAYGTLKCMYLLDEDDRGFWDIGKNLGYGIMGIVKSTLVTLGDTVLIYETDEMCGILTVQSPTEEQDYYHVVADMYRADDLNHPVGFLITAETMEEVYAIINTIELK